LIVLVNTAHHSNSRSPLVRRAVGVAGVEVVELTPSTFGSRRIGKLVNILQVRSVAEAVLKIGNPKAVWLYNGYSFESRFGRIMHDKVACPVILELEDWHFSRGRGWNPKPLLDWFFWRALMPRVSYAFAVNSFLADRMGGVSGRVGLFPGIVTDGIAVLNQRHPPFSRDGDDCVVGYFGGLSVEKGADLVAALVTELPSGFKMIVTGSGELEGAFRKLQEESGGRLAFYGRVDDKKLLELIGSCDVLLNPHAPIDSMDNGVFPFKVIEGIASGRLMISTALPSSGLESILQAVNFVNHDLQHLVRAVVNARLTYVNNLQSIHQGAAAAVKSFGKEKILATINRVLDGAVL
jgi:hypothetical protein